MCRVASKTTELRVRFPSFAQMKIIKGIDGEVIKVEEGSSVQPFHAYISLMLGVLKEPFVSSDAKFLMIQSSFIYLKDMGYSDEEVDLYKVKIGEVYKSNIEINNFMG